MASSRSNFRTSSATRRRAQAISVSRIRFLPDASARPAVQRAASRLGGTGLRAHQEGEQSRVLHVFSFARSRPVTQPVTPLNFFKEAALKDHPLQREFPLLARMEAPSVVPIELVRTARTYREAVRLCWQLRRVRNLTFRQLAAEIDVPYQHVGDYFNGDDQPWRRDLPGDALRATESALGNTAISQWHAMQAQLTVLEEMQASRRAA